jgi:hypothetical protein
MLCPEGIERCDECPKLGDDCVGNDEWYDYQIELDYTNLFNHITIDWEKVLSHEYLERNIED